MTRRATAALRDFDLAYVGSGSIAPDRHDRDARPMSACPPIAVKHWHRSETALRASRRHMQRSKLAFSSLAFRLAFGLLNVVRVIDDKYIPTNAE